MFNTRMHFNRPAKILVCLIFGLLLSTIIFTAAAQNKLPRLEKDTLYTVTGYKLYPGQQLHIGFGTGKNNRFRYINPQGTVTGSSLTNCEITLVSMRDFGISQLNNAYIYMNAHITYKDGSKGSVVFHIAFDNAINNRELNVPEEDRFMDMAAATSSPALNLPRFVHDTLYTSGGGVLYPGMSFRTGTGTDKKGRFKYMKLLNGNTNKVLGNVYATVISLRKFGTDDGEARIEMSYSYKKENGVTVPVSVRIFFDKAIESGELILPEQ